MIGMSVIWLAVGIGCGVVAGLAIGYVALIWYFHRNNPM
jgi:hypothetical protein